MIALRQGNSGWNLVAVDYTASGRTVGTFEDLSGLLQEPVESFLVTDTCGGPTGRDTVQQWAGEINHPVDAVLAYCTGAVYADALVTVLSDDQPAPRLLLIDPEGATDDQLIQQFAHVVTGKLGPALDEASQQCLIAQSRESNSTGSALARHLSQLLDEAAAQPLAALGLGPRAAADMLAAIGGYLSYLGGAIELPAPTHWCRALVINSASSDSGLDALAADAQMSFRTRIDVPVDYADVLRSPITAIAVDEWLASASAEAEQ